MIDLRKNKSCQKKFTTEKDTKSMLHHQKYISKKIAPDLDYWLVEHDGYSTNLVTKYTFYILYLIYWNADTVTISYIKLIRLLSSQLKLQHLVFSWLFTIRDGSFFILIWLSRNCQIINSNWTIRILIMLNYCWIIPPQQPN